MKNILLICGLIFGTFSLFSQESMVTLSGGYAFANIEEVETGSSGFRINGLYEFNPNGGKIAHGLSFGYIGTSATATINSNETADYQLNSWPIYYAPKFMFGGEKFKGFVKGALGIHFSGYKRTGVAGGELDTNDTGFYGGASLGAMYLLSEKMFLNLEYEWAYLSNSWYRDGFMNSAMLGLGFRF